MSGWTSAPVGELVTIVGGGTPTRSNTSYYGGAIPWVTPKDMKSWEIRDAQVNITEAGLDNSATRLVPANSVLVVVRSGILKHTVPIALNRLPVAINQDMKALLCDTRIDADFLARFVKFRSPIILQWVRATTADNFPIDKLKRLAVPLPPLPEQRRIAEILDKVDALRTKRRTALAQLDTITQSIFLDMFGDPVRNERGWPVAAVSDLCELVRGSSPRPQGDPMFFGGPVPRLMVADITRDGWLVTPRIDSLTIEGAKRSRAVPAGTVVMAVSGNVGLVSRLAIDACVHDGFVAFTQLDESRCDSGFLLALLHFSKALHDKHKAGAIFINLTTTDIKAMRLPLPPIDLRREFARRVESKEKLKMAQRTSLSELDALFASLQHRAFRGEL